MRLLAIGIDSADVDYLLPALDRLPHLRGVLRNGVLRRLGSPADPMSASVWPTFLTGESPGVHGQYFPLQWDPARMRLRHVDDSWLACEPFWRPLARAGIPVATLDAPCAFPARGDDGVEIVNWGVDANGGFHCNRPALGRELVRRFGRDAMRFDAPVDKSAGRLALLRRTLLDVVPRRGALARWLLREVPWRFGLVVFSECHRAGHYFWPQEGGGAGDPATGDALLDVHGAIDAQIGRLIADVDPSLTCVVVFSLLGMTRNRSQMHFTAPVLDRINDTFARDEGRPPSRQRSLLRALRRVVPAALQERVALAVPERARDWVIGRAYAGGFDWPRTPGFTLPTGGEGYVRLNLAGREAEGCLIPGSERHGRYLAAVREGFESLRVTGTDEPVVGRLRFPSEEFTGPRSWCLPDVAIAWSADRPATEVRSERLGTFRGRLATGRAGNHRASAFAAVVGPPAVARQAESLETIADLSRFMRDVVLGGNARPA